MWTVHIFKRYPDRTTRKKVVAHNVLPFFGSRFLPRKKFICSKKIKPWRLFSKPSRLDWSLHWNLFTFGIESRRFCKSRHGLISFWNSLTEWNPLVNHTAELSDSEDSGCECVVQCSGICDDRVQGKRLQLITFVPSGRYLFCEFPPPLVSEFDAGSEFVNWNWIWACIFIHLFGSDISRRQSL